MQETSRKAGQLFSSTVSDFPTMVLFIHLQFIHKLLPDVPFLFCITARL